MKILLIVSYALENVYHVLNNIIAFLAQFHLLGQDRFVIVM